MYSGHFSSPNLAPNTLGYVNMPTYFTVNTTLSSNFSDAGGTKSYISITGLAMAWNSNKTTPIIDLQIDLYSYNGTTATFKVYSYIYSSTPNTLWYVTLNWLIYNKNYYSTSRISIDVASFDKVTAGGHNIPSSIKYMFGQYITFVSQFYYDAYRVGLQIFFNGLSSGLPTFQYSNPNLPNSTISFTFIQFSVGVCPSSDPYFSNSNNLCYFTCPERTYG